DSEASRASTTVQENLRYGNSAAETLDFFPVDGGNAPLFVFVHGGYWRACDKSEFSWVAPALVGAGAAVAIINYGLAPATPLEEIVQQVRRAHVWLFQNANRLGIDARRIVTGGHSAGGQLTAMMLATPW